MPGDVVAGVILRCHISQAKACDYISQNAWQKTAPGEQVTKKMPLLTIA
jgi:hypothetical protein